MIRPGTDADHGTGLRVAVAQQSQQPPGKRGVPFSGQDQRAAIGGGGSERVGAPPLPIAPALPDPRRPGSTRSPTGEAGVQDHHFRGRVAVGSSSPIVAGAVGGSPLAETSARRPPNRRRDRPVYRPVFVAERFSICCDALHHSPPPAMRISEISMAALIPTSMAVHERSSRDRSG
jgi:hypothetical protein